MVNERGRENAHRFRIVKLALLKDRLVELDRHRPLGAGFGAFYESIRDHVASELISQGTPFFWYAVDRVLIQSRGDNHGFSQHAEYLLEAGVDALFDWLPEGVAFSFEPLRREIVFSRLGLIIMGAAAVTLARRGVRRVQLTIDGAVRDVDLTEVPRDLSLPALTVPGHRASLLLAAPRSLFGDTYRSQIVPATPTAAALARTIGASLDLIARADAARAVSLEQGIEWYVPIASQDAETHNSFSVRGLFGAIFLSEAYSDLRLAEAIVHEYHHNELYLLQESDSICEFVPGELYYSPWRSDPRPLEGLLHALHVFSGVADLLQRLELVSTGQRRPIRERRLDIARKLRLALCQIRHERLSPSGAGLVQSVIAELDKHASDLGHGEVVRPSELMLRHIDRWRRENPSLADCVRLPGAADTSPTP